MATAFPAFRFANLFFAALLATGILGCGPSRPTRVPISGKVLLDGKPLTSGSVRVIPAKARMASGQIDAQGNFRLTTFDANDGCVLGKHPVEVFGREALGPGQIRHLIPVKYQTAGTSGLTIDVTDPKTDWAIELKSDGFKPFIEKIESSGDVDPAKSSGKDR